MADEQENSTDEADEVAKWLRENRDKLPAELKDQPELKGQREARERIERWLNGTGDPVHVGRSADKKKKLIYPPKPGTLRADFEAVCDKAMTGWSKGKATPEMCAARALTAWGKLGRVKTTTHDDKDAIIGSSGGTFLNVSLNEEGQLKLKTAAWLKGRYCEFCGVVWNDGWLEFLHRLRKNAEADRHHHEVEKAARATSIKLKEAIREIGELAKGGEGGVIWDHLVNRLRPEMLSQPFADLLETTDAELGEALVVDEAGLADAKARFAIGYYRHRAIERYLSASPDDLAKYRKLVCGEYLDEDGTEKTVNLVALERGARELIPDHGVTPAELATAWLLSGLVEGERQGVTVPVRWKTWPSGAATKPGVKPGDVLKKVMDGWKNSRGDGAKQQANAARARWKESGGQKSDP